MRLGGGSVLIALVWERGGRPEAVEGRARLPKLPVGNLSLLADFWLARGIDDVTVQKSADVSEVECPYTTLPLKHISYISYMLPI